MAKFFLHKENKVPLYVQLRDQITYYISTGTLQSHEQLPPVKVLARDLGINFQTVLKAYKELETSGLINVRHGEGTFISLTESLIRENGNGIPPDAQSELEYTAKKLFERHLKQGMEFTEVKKIINRSLAEIERKHLSPVIIFAECNDFQIKQISQTLEAELSLKVLPVLIADLKKEVRRWSTAGREIKIVTTGFHVEETRNAVGGAAIQIDVLITNLNPETRRQFQLVGESGSYSFICRDQESAVLYKDLLKAELGFEKINLSACTLAETKKVRAILDSSDVILVSPPVYEEVRKMAPPDRAIYNVFERVDPMSLRVVKERILKGDKVPVHS